MNKTEQKEVISLIARLEASNSIQDAENTLHEILNYLLPEDGYKIDKTHHKDIPFDFVAKKEAHGSLGSDEIAIEYKHYKQSAVNVSVIHNVLGTALSSGFSRAMLVTNSRFTNAARDSIRKNTPVDIQLFDLNSLRQWVERVTYDQPINELQINIIRQEISKKFIDLIVKNPRYLDLIEWREMEYLLTEIFERLGFSAQLTPGSKDGGKDIILTCRVASQTNTYYIEVKHWRSGQRVGSSAIKEFLNVIVHQEISGGLFLSTYGFCNNAIESLTEIQRKSIRFGTENKIVSLCRSYIKATSGIWSPESSLPEILYEGSF